MLSLGPPESSTVSKWRVAVSGIGPKMLPLYQKLLAPPERPACVLDLLFHLPVTAIDRSHRALLAEAEPDTLTTFTLRVLRHRPPPAGRPNLPYRILCEDDSGDIELVFFNSRRLRLDQTLPEGSVRYVSGRYTLYDGSRQMVHPDRIMDETSFAKSPLIEPVYGQTAGLSSRFIHKSITAALTRLPALPEWHDATVMRQEKFPAFGEALASLHHPEHAAAVTETGSARCRLAYDEVLADIKKRDERDQNRASAPLKMADDAALLDTTKLDREAAFVAALKLVESQISKKA